MSTSQLACPSCSSTHVVKNGKIHNGKQNHKCRECGRQFVQDPQNKIIDPVTKTLIDQLLLEKIPLAGIARVVNVKQPGLQNYVNHKYREQPRSVNVQAKKSGCDPAPVSGARERAPSRGL